MTAIERKLTDQHDDAWERDHASPQRKRLKIYRANDPALMAPPGPAIIRGLMSPGDLQCWYGQPNSGKSFVALHAALCMAHGRPFFGRRVSLTSVLYCDLENNLSRRLQSASTIFGALPANLFVFRGVLNLLDRDDERALTQAAIELRPGVVFLDTLSRAMNGAEENGSQAMTAAVALCDRIREETGAAVVLVHHEGKVPGSGMRGHSSLLAAVDVALGIGLDDSGARTATVTKSRDGELGPLGSFRLHVVPLGTNDDGDPISSCVIAEGESAPQGARPLPRMPASQSELLRIIQSFAVDHAVLKAPSPGMPQVRVVCRQAALDELRRAGWFTAEPDEPLGAKDRGRLRDGLLALRQKRLLGHSEREIWLL